jgi:hypothetical protein
MKKTNLINKLLVTRIGIKNFVLKNFETFNPLIAMSFD